MTVSVQTPLNEYVGDGAVTTFAFTFTIIDNSDLVVKVDDVLQVESTDYTVQNVTGIGGDVVFGSAPVNGAFINISRDTSQDQLVVYNPFDPFPAKTHEGALDKLTLIVQELDLAVGDGGGFDVDGNFNTTGDWNNSGAWAFNGTLTYNGFEVVTFNDLPDLSSFTRSNVDEDITGSWDFQNGIILRGSSWPSDLGTVDFILKTDGAGNLAWIAQAGGTGFDPTASYVLTGTWEFQNTVEHQADITLANEVDIKARNLADTGNVELVQVSAADKAQFGSNSGFSEGTDIITPPGKPGRFVIDNNTVGNWDTLANGGLLVRDLNSLLKKVGFRNPKTVRSLSSVGSLAQGDEGQVVTAIGSTPFSITVPELEEGTTITFKNLSTVSVTLEEDGTVTQIALLGGSSKTGDLVILRDSVVQLHWRTPTIVDVWGGGID